MHGVSLMGAQALGVVIIAVLAALAVRRQWATAASLLLVVVGAQVLNTLLKAAFQRERPTVLELLPAQQFSFPSGHTMVATAVYLYLAYLVWQRLQGFARYALAASLVLLILLVGLSRVYLGVHYASDVIAGFIAGFIWTDTVIIGSRFMGLSTSAEAGSAPVRTARLTESTAMSLGGEPMSDFLSGAFVRVAQGPGTHSSRLSELSPTGSQYLHDRKHCRDGGCDG